MLIETDRLLFRPLRVADAEALASMWSDPEVTRFMGGPRDPAELSRSLEKRAREDGAAAEIDLWPVVERSSGRIVGHCGLLEKEVEGRGEIELIYVFARAAWGKGYATEAAEALKRYAFERLALPRIIALIDPDNAASERVAVKVEMRFERDTLRPSGKTLRLYAAVARTPERP
jgi:ribosomal-protein-alanine N-acetyltransferase